MNVTDITDVLSHGTVYELSHPIENGMPRYPSHPEPNIELARKHGDRFRQDGASSASCRIVIGGHTGTHIDALGHISYDGRLFDGTPYPDAQATGVLSTGGTEHLPPFFRRAVLFDIPSTRGVPVLPPDATVTVEDLEDAAHRQRTDLRPGDVALIRTGWGSLWGDPRYLQADTPGPDEPAARWLLDHGAALVGSDTAVFEKGPVREHAPVHTLTIWERRIPILESLMLETLAAASVHESVFIALPLPLVGATGSPIRAVAVDVPASGS